MILISSKQCVPRPSCPFRGKLGRTGKGSFNEKAKIFDRGSLYNAPDGTGSKVQYEPYLFSVACSQTKLSTSSKIWRSGKESFTEKATIVHGRSLCSTPERTGSELQYEPHLFSIAHSQTKLSIWGKIREIRKRVVHIKKLKSLIEVPYVAHLKVQVLSFNMNNVFSPQGVHRPSYPFR